MIPLPELRSDLVARRGTGRASSEEPHACARDRSDASPDARPPLSFVGSDRVSALRLETAVLLLALLALELAILVPVHLVARRFRAAEPKVLVIAPRVLAEPLVVAPRVLAELALRLESGAARALALEAHRRVELAAALSRPHIELAHILTETALLQPFPGPRRPLPFRLAPFLESEGASESRLLGCPPLPPQAPP